MKLSSLGAFCGDRPTDVRDLKIDYVAVSDLVPYARNARTHSEEQVTVIAASIQRFGWTNPVLIGNDNDIIAGHGRVLAAKRLGLKAVPVLRIGDLSAEERRAYVIADNQTALRAGWDLDVLRLELTELTDMDFDLGPIGFNDAELANILDVRPVGATDPDDVPDPPANPIATRGDLWALGRHRLLCGDATDIEQVKRLIGGVVPDIANCDPPYGIKAVKGATVGGSKPFGSIGGTRRSTDSKHIANFGKVGGGGMTRFGKAKNAVIKANTYSEIIGDDSTETAVRSYALLCLLGVPVVALWGGNYFANDLPPSRCWLVWDKETNGNFADAELAWTNQDAVVRLLRHQWSGLIKASERGERRVHPTQKPVALAEWVIETLAPKAKTAIDLFVGSGSTLIACERKGIACYGMEMAEAYCDVIIQRWQNFTGLEATLDGKSFAKVKTERIKLAQLDTRTAIGV
jgi:ParB-like chromosome segregation protein Spo0J